MAEGIQIGLLTPDSLEPAFELASEVFVNSSTLHRALNIGLREYRSYLLPSFEQMIDEGLSVMARNDETGEVVGCLIATDFAPQSDEGIEVRGKFTPLAALTQSLCRQYHEHRSIVTGQVVLADMGVVSESALGTGVYQRMRDALCLYAQRRGFDRIVGELSSAATQHVVIEKLGHEVCAEIVFADFEFDGERPFNSITEPRSIILAEGTL